jgi:cytoskeletal protein RodZ
MLEAGHCLTRKQVASYCGSLTSAEEVLAVEHHLHACPFCRDTVEAISKGGSDAQQTLAQLDDRFLTEHFKKHSPQVHLNSMAIPVRRARKSSPWRTIGLAAAVIVGIGFWWFSQSRTRQQEAVASEMNVIPDNPSATSVTGGEPLHTAPQSRKEPSTVVQAAVRTPVAAPKSTRKEKHVQEELPLVTDAGKLVNPKREPAPKKETSSVEKSKLESMPNAVPETKISAEPEMGPIPMPEAPPKENKDPE